MLDLNSLLVRGVATLLCVRTGAPDGNTRVGP